ncbi:MAG: F0F1 ATP synthase subunit delta [Atribacterota bacterium]|nr:F0F1 ATP synthase subunit delta [Candidatus Atribacteria bacterium]
MSNSREVVKIITPFPLTEKQRDTIYQKLSRIADMEHAVFQEELDPSLIGGVIIMCGEIYIDCSLETQLEKMRERILSEGMKA